MKNNLREIVIIIFVLAIIGYIVYIVINKEPTKVEEESPKRDNSKQELIYKGTNEITSNEELKNKSYEGSTSDNNVFLISGDIAVNMNNITINKTGDTASQDNSSFYGVNAGILVKDKASLNIKNSTITTDGNGANGIFSSNNSKVVVEKTTITTNKDASGGIMVVANGNITAKDLSINTSGRSSAAIRSDRGGGVINVTGGTYTTNGIGSPAIYSTADITVNDAKLVSNHSEGVVIEGKNSITLDSVTLINTNDTLNGKSTTYKNIFLYQSMSGDATNGVSVFKATDSSITTNKGDVIYVTNTDAEIHLTNNEFITNSENGYFIRIKKDSWGVDGFNGGVVNLYFDNQSATGDIYVDSISTLNVNMSNKSYFEGTINGDNTGGKIELVLDKKSKIKLTGDSYVTSINDANRAYTNIDFNGFKLYVNGTSIN